VGLAQKSVALSRPPGWEPESYGYHGDDGHAYSGHNVGKVYGPPFTTGDTVGCGINFRTGIVFFTKNGVNLGKG
jgi:Ran-binding protein 9/10